MLNRLVELPTAVTSSFPDANRSMASRTAPSTSAHLGKNGATGTTMWNCTRDRGKEPATAEHLAAKVAKETWGSYSPAGKRQASR